MIGLSNIKQRFGKIILLTVCCVSILLSFTGCPGLSDWIYYLPNNYAIMHVNNRTIGLAHESEGRGSGHFRKIVDAYITEFCYNEQFVAVKQMDPETMDFEDFESNDFDAAVYYLVDMINHQVYGPYATAEEFDAALESNGVSGLGEWKATRPNPNWDES